MLFCSKAKDTYSHSCNLTWLIIISLVQNQFFGPTDTHSPVNMKISVKVLQGQEIFLEVSVKIWTCRKPQEKHLIFLYYS